MKTSTILMLVGGTVVVTAAVVIATRKSGVINPEETDEGDDVIDQGKFENNEKPLAVGEATDSSVAPYVAEAQQIWDDYGIPRDVINVVQFWTMSKAPLDDGDDDDAVGSRPVAVAPRATWERTAEFVADVVVPILRDFERRGGDLDDLRFGGYRPADYNDAVDGAPRSRHVDADGIDIIPRRNATKNADLILAAIARFKVDHPSDPIGFGAYAGNGHVDIGGRRNWSGKTVPGKAEKYLKRAEDEARVS